MDGLLYDSVDLCDTTAEPSDFCFDETIIGLVLKLSLRIVDLLRSVS